MVGIQHSAKRDRRQTLRRRMNLAHNSVMREPSEPSTTTTSIPAPTADQRPVVVRWLYLVLAVLCLVMGVIGIIVPGLPTTVFILIAGWAAARGSPRLHAWLWNHRLFGPMLREWANGGRVSRKTKWSATIVMALCACIILLISAPIWVKITANACMACVLTWLWFRPEPPTTGPEH